MLKSKRIKVVFKDDYPAWEDKMVEAKIDDDTKMLVIVDALGKEVYIPLDNIQIIFNEPV